ncbi:MAG: VOC family protein [Spirochaetes bacterium]|nr:VOC family protein [Spirochaetota bacterium]
MIVIESVDHVGITVSNLERSIEFYRELFDFEIIEKFSDARQAFLRVGDIVLGLYEIEGYKNQSGTKNHISFYIDEEDFEDAIDEIKERDIPIVFGPDNLRKGKSVVFLDPDGNQIELCYPRMS